MSGATTISTHVLDTSLGAPASGVAVLFERIDTGGTATELHRGVTDSDGRIARFAPPDAPLTAGSYRLRFDVSSYFTARGTMSFYQEIAVAFVLGDEPQHYHVPLLLSPFGYSTYRGS